MAETEKLLVAEHIVKKYDLKKKLFDKEQKTLKAVDDVSFYINKGETFGVVGESGCGKTTLGKCVVRLHKPTSGQLFYNDDGELKDLLNLNKKESFELRKKIQIVFQDPYSSFNPVHTIYEAFDEPLRIHNMGNKEERMEIIADALRTVNLQPEYMKRYPHEFSGGQRQRICIAKALALKPDLIVCDEPVSALDVSIQAQILNLMRKIQRDLGVSYMFIAHDLSVVQYMSHRIAVMYLGKIVETADAKELHTECLHPYTQALLSAVPIPKYGEKMAQMVLPGDVPSPINPPSGCRFHPRCEHCMEICKHKEPELRTMTGTTHQVACHLFDEDSRFE
ncbi:MAG: ATP-binding cassette domain-containing protein [Eubacteriales bacterium]|nr:ATP-binding cassette domain-containing protein [Eubacteriales bacterium]